MVKNILENQNSQLA